jgi:hypothetical protein
MYNDRIIDGQQYKNKISAKISGGITMKLQRKFLTILLAFTVMLGITACASAPNEAKPQNTAKPPANEGKANTSADSAGATIPDAQPGRSGEKNEVKVKITVGNQVRTATFIDNATTRSLIAKFPLTIPMQELYSRELVYHFPDPLPSNEAQTSGYEVGDISYWTPRHSFVIFYKQNGEVISNLQKIGRIDSGVEIFGQTGNTNITFELLNK